MSHNHSTESSDLGCSIPQRHCKILQPKRYLCLTLYSASCTRMNISQRSCPRPNTSTAGLSSLLVYPPPRRLARAAITLKRYKRKSTRGRRTSRPSAEVFDPDGVSSSAEDCHHSEAPERGAGGGSTWSLNSPTSAQSVGDSAAVLSPDAPTGALKDEGAADTDIAGGVGAEGSKEPLVP